MMKPILILEAKKANSLSSKLSSNLIIFDDEPMIQRSADRDIDNKRKRINIVNLIHLDNCLLSFTHDCSDVINISFCFIQK